MFGLMFSVSWGVKKSFKRIAAQKEEQKLRWKDLWHGMGCQPANCLRQQRVHH